MRLIDKDELEARLKDFYGVQDGKLLSVDATAAMSAIDEACEIETVPLGVYHHKAWECAIMKEQLDRVGLSLGEKTDDVVKVVRCKDCQNSECFDERLGRYQCSATLYEVSAEGYCSRGVRKVEKTNG